jgi:RNA recognition motif-containing protein
MEKNTFEIENSNNNVNKDDLNNIIESLVKKTIKEEKLNKIEKKKNKNRLDLKKEKKQEKYEKKKKENEKNKKNPNFKESKDPERTNIYEVLVSNLSWTVTEDELFNFFSSCGNIQSITIPYDNELKRIKGFSFVRFNDKESFVKALELNNKMFKERILKIIERKKQNEPDLQKTKGNDDKIVCIKNLSQFTTEVDLKKLFSEYGDVIIRRPVFNDTGKFKNFAFIEFQSIDSAKQSLEKNGLYLNDKEIIINYGGRIEGGKWGK